MQPTETPVDTTPVMQPITILTPVQGMKGKRWSEAEDRQLLVVVANGMPFNEIADLHQRTVGGVTMRLLGHAVTAVHGGMSVQDAAVQFKLPEDRINKELNKPPKQPKSPKPPTVKQPAAKRVTTKQPAIFPVPTPKTEVDLLIEIRDLLKALLELELEKERR